MTHAKTPRSPHHDRTPGAVNAYVTQDNVQSDRVCGPLDALGDALVNVHKPRSILASLTHGRWTAPMRRTQCRRLLKRALLQGTLVLALALIGQRAGMTEEPSYPAKLKVPDLSQNQAVA
jgi:hypothetical protein